MRDEVYSPTSMSAAGQNALLRSVYNWMMLGLFTSAGAAYITIHSETMMQLLFGNSYMLWVLLIAELGLVFAISGAVKSMTAATASILFMLFSALNGLTLSSILLIYTAQSITSTFLITGLTFGATSFYGYVTKKDLTSWGHFLFMGLIGIIIAAVVNIFWQNSMFDLMISFIGIIIFVGLTAYDTQKIRRLGEEIGAQDGEAFGKIAIIGALSLYLDFVNLFLMLLRFFGREK